MSTFNHPFTRGQRVIRDDGLRATFLRDLPSRPGYAVFRYDDDNTPERVSYINAFSLDREAPDADAATAPTCGM